MTFGQRAAELIEERAKENSTTIQDEMDKLDICGETRLHWKRGQTSPRLATMAILYQNGYDIGYILTGEKT